MIPRSRHVPIRLCSGCRSRDENARMVRFTLIDGRPQLDRTRRAPGRGAYLHVRPACLEGFLSRKPFVRSLRASISKLDRANLVDRLMRPENA